MILIIVMKSELFFLFLLDLIINTERNLSRFFLRLDKRLVILE